MIAGVSGRSTKSPRNRIVATNSVAAETTPVVMISQPTIADNQR